MELVKTLALLHYSDTFLSSVTAWTNSLVAQEIRLEPVEEEVLESKLVCLLLIPFSFLRWPLSITPVLTH